MSSPLPDAASDLAQLSDQLNQGAEKSQRQVIAQLAALGEVGWPLLQDFLKTNYSDTPKLAMAEAYQALRLVEQEAVQEFLNTQFPLGIFPLKSARNIDYRPLQMALAQQEFELADNLTREKLCELAGEGAIQRKWLYFTEVERFPGLDLHTINALWWLHSGGKFGFSVQRKLWLSVGKDFTKLWPKIDWKNGNSWTKYPAGFTWDLSAPAGHLPLLNQLRGVRVAASLYGHPVWSEYQW
ncbi:GUN4 N-terminal ARM-like repeat domain-containing protein [Synechocystis sp. LKSZ1]|uniref:GUN4 N-terminal ARM-like repeat domain-containing protein n=1 Tax=Synechocystis sp. LKSZ1 TaxID=3144951 RepID=UPI00336C0F8B